MYVTAVANSNFRIKNDPAKDCADHQYSKTTKAL